MYPTLCFVDSTYQIVPGESKADTLIAAIKKGFDEATEAWGDKLPDICQKTIDAAVKKMEAWRDGTTSETDA